MAAETTSFSKTISMSSEKLCLILFSCMLIVSSCNNKNENLPNSSFREKIIPKITDKENLKKFDSLLTSLDKSGISYCQFVQRIFEIEDSCYNAAKKRYPDPETEDDFVKLNLQSVKEVETKYLSALNLNKEFSMFATTVYNLDQTIKTFCTSP